MVARGELGCRRGPQWGSSGVNNSVGEGFCLSAFATQLALHGGPVLFSWSAPCVQPFSVSEYNTASLADCFVRGSQSCLKYFL